VCFLGVWSAAAEHGPPSLDAADISLLMLSAGVVGVERYTLPYLRTTSAICNFTLTWALA
jgi:hypothetical protein